jgi:hypothetical protein
MQGGNRWPSGWLNQIQGFTSFQGFASFFVPVYSNALGVILNLD